MPCSYKNTILFVISGYFVSLFLDSNTIHTIINVVFEGKSCILLMLYTGWLKKIKYRKFSLQSELHHTTRLRIV